MNKLGLFLSMFISVFSFSQDKEGVAYYAEKTISKNEEVIRISLDTSSNESDSSSSTMVIDGMNPFEVDEINNALALAFAKSLEKKMVLVFKGYESYYREVYEDLKEEEVTPGIKGTQVIFETPLEEYYFNSKTKSLITLKEFMSKKFIIKKNNFNRHWKITGAEKSIGKYNCTKAIYEDSTTKIEAWYTTDGNVNLAPRDITGLPGLLVEATIETKSEDKILLVLEHIEFREIKEKIKEPKKGKVLMSEEEYERIIKLWMKKDN